MYSKRNIVLVNDGTTKASQCMLAYISVEKVGHGYSTSPSASRNAIPAAAIMSANAVVLQSNVVSICCSLMWKAEFFQNVQLHEGLDVSIRSHQ